MTREEKDKVIQFAVDIIETAQHYELTEFISHINALPVKYPFNPDWPPDEAIRETIRERDDALKEVERLKNESSAYLLGYDDGVKQMEAVKNKAKWQEKEVARLTSRLALAERVMRNLAKVLCSPRYDRGDGCGDEEKMLANYGWTKEDAE